MGVECHRAATLSTSTPIEKPQKGNAPYEGSRDAEVHADPDDTAMFLRAISRLSPSTYAKEKLRLPM